MGAALAVAALSSSAVLVGSPPVAAEQEAVASAVAPGAPTNVTAVAGDRSAQLSWTPPSSDGGSPITHYVVRIYIDSFLSWKVWVPASKTSRFMGSLGNGEDTVFAVTAHNAIGSSGDGFSNVVVPSGSKPFSSPFASWSAYVKQAYADMAGRAPSSSELAAAVTALGSYGPKAKAAFDLRTSAEHTTNVDPTARLYRAFLGRGPDAGGLLFWIGRRRSGSWSLTRMADSFATSTEFTRKYGSLTNRQFVTRIYTDVLGRTADQAGVDYWTKKLDTKSKTRGGVMVGFSESNEYKRKQATNTDVSVAYILLLRRAPKAIEVEAWLGQVAFGTNHPTLLDEILNGPEYHQRFGG